MLHVVSLVLPAGLWTHGLALPTALLLAAHTPASILESCPPPAPSPLNPNPFSSHSLVERNYQVSGPAYLRPSSCVSVLGTAGWIQFHALFGVHSLGVLEAWLCETLGA